MPEETLYTGLNITGNGIQLVEIASGGGTIVLENIGEKKHSRKLNFNKRNDFTDVFRDTLTGLKEEAGINKGAASVSLPPRFFRIFESPLEDKLRDEDIAEYLKWEFSILYPEIKDDTILTPLKLYRPEGNSSRVAAVVLRKDLLVAVKEVLAEFSLQLRTADHAHSAFNRRLVSAVNPADSYSLSIYFGDEFYSVIKLFADNIAGFSHKKYDAGKTKAATAVEEAERFSGELSGDNSVETIYIGTDSHPGRIAEEIQQASGIPAEVFNPFRNMKIKPSLKENIHLKSDLRKFSAACSAALRLL